MRHRKANDPASATGSKTKRPVVTRRRRSRWRILAAVVLLLAVLLGLGRAILPWAVRNYVNRTIDRNPLYSGTIGQVRIHLWRGAYSVEDVRISKVTGNVPVPFFAAKRVDFALQWDSLLHRKIVGRVLMHQAELNFVDASSEDEMQTGAGAAWFQMIQDLFPFKINRAIVHDGSIHFLAFKSTNPVDVYLSKVELTVDNLGNIRDETAPLISTVQATALVMDQAKLEYKMTLDPFSYHPTFHLAVRILGLDVTKLNDLALAYGKFDFKRGWFDLVLETDSKEGQYTGYIKPLFRNLQVFGLVEDLKTKNALQFFWQALVGGVTSVLTNPMRDQFGTLIPFSGDVSTNTTTDFLATLGNILRNAFIRAYLPRLENGQKVFDGLQFGAPDFTQSLSVQDSP